MVTTKPQWATPERQEHLVRLFAQYQNRCKQGHATCPDLRHHYGGCAVEHESVRTRELRQRIQNLTDPAVKQQARLQTFKRMQEPQTPYDPEPDQIMALLSVAERKRPMQLSNEQRQLDNELAKLRAECSIPEHYFEHLLRAMFDETPLEIPLSYYRKVSEGAIEAWKADDREERSYLWKLEQQQILDGTYGRYGSDFDPVARDVYHQQQPAYYLLGFGIGAESKKRIAVIRVPSTYIRLYVEVADAFQGVSISKNKKRKMARYQAGPPAAIWERIDSLCSQAVDGYWASRSVSS